MLRKIRITLAAVCFILITLLFLDFTGTLHAVVGWLAKIQFLPAVLALHVGIVAGLIVLTLVFGRIYCSVICPLGVFQDIISGINGRRKKKKYRFSYSPALSWLRYLVLLFFAITLVAGIGSVAALLAPYSSYGRIAQNLLAPFWQWGNNLFAYFAERVDSYAFYETEVWIRSLPTFLVACITFVVLFVLAWRNGRTYCNTICPVGTVLGFWARYSLFRPVLDPEKCKKCGLCSRSCKAACIDSQNYHIDYSRCVVCMNCTEVCNQGAIRYGLRLKKERTPESRKSEKTDGSRRVFLTGMGLWAASAVARAQEKKVDGGLALILDKKIPERTTPIEPPGSLGLRHMTQHCTACQLCVSVCPNGVLRPSARLSAFMQPEVSYERGYCRPECTKCSEVCPAGAISKITPADKSAIQVGHAVWIRENCIPVKEGVKCNNCARHCPAEAIQMVLSDPSRPESPRIPVVNVERCIGCGACENLCPSRPFSAMYVEGHEVHRTI